VILAHHALSWLDRKTLRAAEFMRLTGRYPTRILRARIFEERDPIRAERARRGRFLVRG